MLRTSTVVVLLFANIASANPVSEADQHLQKKYPADKPGAAVLIVDKGKTMLLAGYGLADVEQKRAITPDSAFDLASVSKQFTAMAVMMLAERGKLGYDDELRRWVPEMPAFEGKRPIKIRDLLCHTSGLPDYLGLFKGSDADFAKFTNLDVPKLYDGKKLRFPTGTKWEYSNTNYALLPIIVERASGKTFASFMRDQVFRPLGMNDTKVTDECPFVVNNRVTGYGKKYMIVGKLEKSSRDGPICGDGSVFATARDLAKWDTAMAQHTLVRPATLQLAYTPAKLDDGKPTDYGFGWMIKERDGKKLVTHSGGWAGTRTCIFRWLTADMTIVVLCNDEGADPEKTAIELRNIMLGKPPAGDAPAKAK